MYRYLVFTAGDSQFTTPDAVTCAIPGKQMSIVEQAIDQGRQSSCNVKDKPKVRVGSGQVMKSKDKPRSIPGINMQK